VTLKISPLFFPTATINVNCISMLMQ